MALSVKAGEFALSLGAATTTQAITGVGFTPKVVLFFWNFAPGIPLIARSSAAHSNQGVARDATRFWTSGANDAGTSQNLLRVWGVDGSDLPDVASGEVTTRDCTNDAPGTIAQVNGIFYHAADGLLYVTANNFPSSGSYLLIYDPDDLASGPVATHTLSDDTIEGVVWSSYTSSWWAYYHDKTDIEEYDANWSLVSTKSLPSVPSGTQFWNGGVWVENRLYLNPHNDNADDNVWVYEYDGSAFTFLNKLPQPAANAGQGMFLYDSTTLYMAERTPTTLEGNVLKCTLGETLSERGHTAQGMGAATATQQGAAVTRASNAVATSVVTKGMRDDACIIYITGTIQGRASLTSMDADGFTLTIDQQFTSLPNLRVGYLALGGSDLTDAAVYAFRSKGTTGADAHTGIGFQPESALFFHAGVTNASLPSVENAGFSGFGAAVSSTQRACLAMNDRTSVNPSDGGSYGYGAEAIAGVSGAAGSAVSHRADFTSFDEDGFTLNWTEAGAQVWILAVLLAGVDFAVGSSATRTDTTEFSVTGLGFRPKALVFGSHMQVESTQDTSQAGVALSLGVATSATQRIAFGSRSADNVSPTQCSRVSRDDAVAVTLDDSGATVGRMDVVSMDEDGFTLVMDDADPTANFFWYWAIGGGTEANAGGRYRYAYRLAGVL